jgi:catalase
MHAKGSGAFGTFTVTHDITKYTKARIFSQIGKKTEMFARFSTVAGERGAADAERDIRGFALKFYTEDGNWDMVGNNTPVFFFRDPLKFIDLNHAVKRDPRTNLRSPNTNWDFWTSLPEALLQVTIVMSDRGIPSSYRFMHGFSSHAYSFINAANERCWVKFHFRSQQGIQNYTDQEAEMVAGMDRESHQRDLYEAIEQRKFPRWAMFVQIMTEAQADAMKTNPFDLTKQWPKAEYPLLPVGEFELNRNPDNYFAQVEQSAFTPANVVPGISFSPDRMLQGRLFSYGDAHRYRLGVNHHQIPVNSPLGVAHPHAFHRDGQMRVDGNLGSEVHVEPNSYGNWTESDENFQPRQAGGDVFRYDFREDDDDYYTQPGLLYRAMTPDQRRVLVENTARNMGDSTVQIRHRHIANCFMADPDYGTQLAKALNIALEDVDLDLPRRSSRAGNHAANNAHPELNVPGENRAMAQWEEIRTEYDPKSFIDAMEDPYVL